MAYRFKRVDATSNRFYLSEDGIRVCASCFRLPNRYANGVVADKLHICEVCLVQMCRDCTRLQATTWTGRFGPKHLFMCRECSASED